MNRIYSLVFNRTTGLWQVANEHAKGRTKGKRRSSSLLLTGTLLVGCGTPFTDARANILTAGEVTPDLGTWYDTMDLVVGNTLTGAVSIGSPDIVRSATGRLGVEAGSEGRVTVWGGTPEGVATWLVGNSLSVGGRGTGVLTLAEFGTLSVNSGMGSVKLGEAVGAVGTLNIGIAPGSMVLPNFAGILGAKEVLFGDGQATLNFNSINGGPFGPALVSSGQGQHALKQYAGITQLQGNSSRFDGTTTVSGGTLQIVNKLGTSDGTIDAGTGVGASANVAVYGAGSGWIHTGNLLVGKTGPGDLNIYSAGTVSNSFGVINALQGTARVTVSGIGSRWTNRNALTVGNTNGKGALSILMGGSVSNGDGYVGGDTNGEGSVRVEGAGSTWTNSGDLRVGDMAGRGTLSIGAGGLVSNVNAVVGSMGGTGTVVVSGANATWNNTGTLDVGFELGPNGFGKADLTIADGGVVNVGTNGAGVVSLAPDGLGNFLPGVGVAGTINIGAEAAGTAVKAGRLNAAAIEFGKGIATLNFNHTDTNYQFTTALISARGTGPAHRLNQIAGTTFLTGANAAFKGAISVSGGKLVLLGPLGGSAAVTGGVLQYGDGASDVANSLTGNLTVSGAGSTLAVHGPATLTVAGDAGLGNHTVLEIAAGTSGPALLADTVTLGTDVSFRLSGINNTNTTNVLLIDTKNGINGEFANIDIGGSGNTNSVDYLSINTRKSADNRQFLASYNLAWTANNSLAHGTFTLANTADTFTVGAVLADQTANPVTGWNGKTLTKAGNGTLMLSGANTYSGGTSITGGTVAIERDANLGAATGGLLLNGGTLATTASFDSARTITVANAGGIDVAANAALHLTGAFTGNGDFTKSGNGLLTLQGDSSGFTGQTLVNAGQLIINGLFGGSLTLRNGALLGGNATIGSAHSTLTVASGGTLSPGNSIGLVTVKGDLVMQPGSHFVVETDPDGTAADRVHVTGNALLNGGSVMHIGAAGNYGLQSNYTILQVDGTLSGRFDTVASDFAFLTPSLAYDYGQGRVSLNLDRNDVSMSLTGSTPNQRATAAAIDSMGVNSGHALYNAVVSLPNDAKLLHASFDQLSGEVHASAKTALLQDSLYLRDAMGDRLQGSFTAPTSWLQALGNWNHVHSNSNTGSLNSSSGGFLMGIDAPIANNWQLGLLAGYSRTSFDVNSRSSSGHSNNYHVGAYTGGQWGAVRLQGGVAYSWNNLATRRSVNMPGFTDQLNASYDGHTAQAFVDVGYGIDASVVTLEPFANLAYVNLRTNRYSESGGAAALQAAGQTTNTTLTTLGLRATTDFDVGSTQVVARGSLGWRHAMGDITPYSTHAFSAGSAFDVAGAALARDSAVVELGLAMQLKAHTSLGLSYQGQISDSTQNHGVKANLLVRF